MAWCVNCGGDISDPCHESNCKKDALIGNIIFFVIILGIIGLFGWLSFEDSKSRYQCQPRRSIEKKFVYD